MSIRHRVYKTKVAILKHFEAVYEEGGQSAVHEEASTTYKKHPLLKWEVCDACGSEVPSVGHTCLNCGQETH